MFYSIGSWDLID